MIVNLSEHDIGCFYTFSRILPTGADENNRFEGQCIFRQDRVLIAASNTYRVEIDIL